MYISVYIYIYIYIYIYNIIQKDLIGECRWPVECPLSMHDVSLNDIPLFLSSCPVRVVQFMTVLLLSAAGREQREKHETRRGARRPRQRMSRVWVSI